MSYRTPSKNFIRLRHEWEKRGYNQASFAKAIGCSEGHLSTVLNEHSFFSWLELKKISELLEISQNEVGEIFNIGVPVVSAAEKPKRVLRFVSIGT